MDKITIEDFGQNQCQVKVGKHRVAYVCYGDGKPINWLPRSVTGLQLTDGEKLEVAKEIRREMAERTQAKGSVIDELAEISSPSYKHQSGHGTQQGPNSKRGNKAQDQGSPGS